MHLGIHYPCNDPGKELISPINRRLFEYWESRKIGGRIPRLSALDLMDIYRVAPYLIIRDAIDDNKDFRTRYWGGGIADAYGCDMTGHLLSGDYGKGSDEIIKYYRMILRDQVPVRAVGNLIFVSKRDHICYECLFLPLLNDHDETVHVISSWDFDYTLSAEEKAKIEEQAIEWGA